MSLYVSFSLQSNIKWNLEGSYALEGPKYWEKTYFAYFWRHQVHMYFQPSAPSHVATSAKVSSAATAKIFFVTLNLFFSYKTPNKLINKKRKFSK
jgi:hypothetical protein